MPVNSVTSPASARLYKPFVSRAMTVSSDASTNTSINGIPSEQAASRTSRRASRYGDIAATSTATP